MQKQRETNLITSDFRSKTGLKQIWKLAWPVIVIEVLVAANNLLDSAFVRGLETSALTALGGSYLINYLIIGTSIAVGATSITLVSRYYGARDILNYRKAIQQVISSTIVCGLLVSVVGFLTIEALAIFILPDHDVQAIAYMVEYLRYCYLALPCALLVKCIAGVFIASGNSKSAMVVSGSLVFLHALLNTILIPESGLGFGMTGAGLAYFSSYLLAALVYLYYAKLIVGEGGRLFTLPDLGWFKRYVRQLIPNSSVWVVRVVTIAGLLKLLADMHLGSEVIAGYRVALAVEALIFSTTLGLGMAGSSLVGQRIGAGRADEAERISWTIAHFASGLMLIFCVLQVIYARELASLIIDNKPLVIKEATLAIQILAATSFINSYGYTLSECMRGAGDSARAMKTQLFYFILPRLPIAIIMCKLITPAAHLCWLAVAFTKLTHGVAAASVFRQGKWKKSSI